MKQTVGVGQKAPEFQLADAEGNRITLSESLKQGPVVLIFYPGDNTPGCTIQLCAIRDDWSEFQTLNASVFGVNHAERSSHRAFATAHGFPFPLLVDTDRNVSRAYGAVRSLLGTNVIRRTVVVISPDGIIRYYRAGLPKTSEILKAIKQHS